MKCVPVHHGIPAVLHRDEPWLHRHSENGAIVYLLRSTPIDILLTTSISILIYLIREENSVDPDQMTSTEAS